MAVVQTLQKKMKFFIKDFFSKYEQMEKLDRNGKTEFLYNESWPLTLRTRHELSLQFCKNFLCSFFKDSQQAFTCLKSTTETLEKCVKYVQS